MARRTRGDGAVYQRASDGLYLGAVRLPDGTRRYVSGKTPADVVAKLNLLKGEIARGEARKRTPPTLAVFLRDYLAGLDLAPNTLRRYRLDAARWTRALGRARLQQITVPQVQQAMAAWRADGLSSGSIVNARAFLRAALTEAQRQQLVTLNVAALARPPRVERRQHPALTVEDALRIVDAFRSHPYAHLVTAALGTGLRQGELLGLGWEDVDLDTGTLRVRGQVQRQDGAYVLRETKQHQQATLALPGFVVAALRAQRIAQREARLLAGERWRDTGRVFTRPDGYYLNGPSVTHRFRQRLAEARVELDVTFHDLRHATGTILTALGVNLRIVADILRHADPGITGRYYAHVAPQTQREAIERLNDALGGANG